jgi:hypothetical protein
LEAFRRRLIVTKEHVASIEKKIGQIGSCSADNKFPPDAFQAALLHFGERQLNEILASEEDPATKMRKINGITDGLQTIGDQNSMDLFFEPHDKGIPVHIRSLRIALGGLYRDINNTDGSIDIARLHPEKDQELASVLRPIFEKESDAHYFVKNPIETLDRLMEKASFTWDEGNQKYELIDL